MNNSSAHLSHYISSANIQPPTFSTIIRAHKGLDSQPINNSQRREIGNLAIWKLSSAKQGNGVLQLRDGDPHTFWQSDGQQPHFINIKFPKKMKVSDVCLYLDSTTDQSYTPSKIAIRAANSFSSMIDIKTIQFESPVGWFLFPLEYMHPETQSIVQAINFPYVITNQVQISIIANQHSGRDTHIRQVKIFAPRLQQGLFMNSFDMAFPQMQHQISFH